MEVNKPSRLTGVINIPLLGVITAGEPVEAYEILEEITISKDLIKRSGDHFALKVNGDSMIDEGIFNGDTVIVRKQQTAENGETIVALINGNETTLKKIYREKKGFRLQPANPALKPIFVEELEVQGKVVSVIRNFDKSESENSNKKEFSEATVKYMDEADMKYRKSMGQYFTPKSIREKLLGKLPSIIKNPKVLDPACGTGEFLLSAQEYFKNPDIHGWDIDKNLIGISKKIAPKSKLKIEDSLLNENYPTLNLILQKKYGKNSRK
ncbi:MAG: transcriptional repressor LexA [Candidatus Wolfebacteria bacterium]|nr:transcriptional repressor LexA [Candidatus Wolfebacteria bacterium]